MLPASQIKWKWRELPPVRMTCDQWEEGRQSSSPTDQQLLRPLFRYNLDQLRWDENEWTLSSSIPGEITEYGGELAWSNCPPLSCFVSKLFPCGSSFLQQKLTVYIKFLMQKPASSLVQLVNGTPSLLQLMLLVTYQTSLRSDSKIHHGRIKNQISFINTAPTNGQTWAGGERVGHNKKIVFFPLMGHVNATLHFSSIKSWLNPDGRNKKYELIYAISIWIA